MENLIEALTEEEKEKAMSLKIEGTKVVKRDGFEYLFEDGVLTGVYELYDYNEFWTILYFDDKYVDGCAWYGTLEELYDAGPEFFIDYCAEWLCDIYGWEGRINGFCVHDNEDRIYFGKHLEGYGHDGLDELENKEVEWEKDVWEYVGDPTDLMGYQVGVLPSF